MAVKEVEYSRTFLSRTDKRDISHHGSPTYEDFQTTSKEEENIRKQIEHDFEFDKKRGGRFWGGEEMFGFDGKILYSYIIRHVGLSGEESSENKPYQTEVHIRKAGSIIDLNLNELSDLERFLVNNEFQKK